MLIELFEQNQTRSSLDFYGILTGNYTTIILLLIKNGNSDSSGLLPARQ